MIPVVRVKAGVLFTKIAPAGFRILRAFDQTATSLGIDLEVTSACDGEHSGPADPHHSGEAYDLHTQSYTSETKAKILDTIIRILGTEYFYTFLEDAGTPNEHIHSQRKRGTVFPPVGTNGNLSA